MPNENTPAAPAVRTHSNERGDWLHIGDLWAALKEDRVIIDAAHAFRVASANGTSHTESLRMGVVHALLLAHGRVAPLLPEATPGREHGLVAQIPPVGIGSIQDPLDGRHHVVFGVQTSPWCCVPEKAREMALGLLKVADLVDRLNAGTASEHPAD